MFKLSPAGSQGKKSRAPPTSEVSFGVIIFDEKKIGRKRNVGESSVVW